MSPELEILRQTLRRAASTEILPRFRQADARTKADGSLVTAADLGTQACIVAELKDRFPGIPVLGELRKKPSGRLRNWLRRMMSRKTQMVAS